MNNQILFIYELPFLFNIFEEIKENLNFQIISLTKKEITKTNFSQYENYLILSKKENLNLSNVILVDDFPIKFSKVLEKINIGFLKRYVEVFVTHSPSHSKMHIASKGKGTE